MATKRSTFQEGRKREKGLKMMLRKQKIRQSRKVMYSATCSEAVMCKKASFMKSSRVNPPETGDAPPPPTAHNMLRTPWRPSSLLIRNSSSIGKARSSKTQRGVISSNVSSICACKSGARLLAPSSYIHKMSSYSLELSVMVYGEKA